MTRSCKPEEQLHRSVVQALRTMMPAPPQGPYWFHPHNEGWRSKAEAGVAKAMGQRAGNPDLWFVWHGEGRRPFAIELKAPKGRVSDNQQSAHQEIHQAGGGIHVCRKLDEVLEVLENEGVPLRGAVRQAN